MSDAAYRRVIVAALAALSLLVLFVTSQRNAAERDRDAYRSQVDSLQLQIIRGCTAHPDGSGECKAGVLAVPGLRLVAAP